MGGPEARALFKLLRCEAAAPPCRPAGFAEENRDGAWPSLVETNGLQDLTASWLGVAARVAAAELLRSACRWPIVEL